MSQSLFLLEQLLFMQISFSCQLAHHYPCDLKWSQTHLHFIEDFLQTLWHPETGICLIYIVVSWLTKHQKADVSTWKHVEKGGIKIA